MAINRTSTPFMNNVPGSQAAGGTRPADAQPKSAPAGFVDGFTATTTLAPRAARLAMPTNTPAAITHVVQAGAFVSYLPLTIGPAVVVGAVNGAVAKLNNSEG